MGRRWHARPPCRGQQSWRGKRGTVDEAGVLPGHDCWTPEPVRAPGVPRLSRRLGRPRHAGGACHRTSHPRLRFRPKTQSWVGVLVELLGPVCELQHELHQQPDRCRQPDRGRRRQRAEVELVGDLSEPTSRIPLPCRHVVPRRRPRPLRRPGHPDAWYEVRLMRPSSGAAAPRVRTARDSPRRAPATGRPSGDAGGRGRIPRPARRIRRG